VNGSHSLNCSEAQIRVTAGSPSFTQQAIFARLRSRRLLPESLGIHKVETSGSTGMPFAYERSRSCEAALMALSDRMFRWWSVDGSKSLARVVNDKHNKALPPNGAINVGWHSEHPTGTRYTLSVAADIDTQLRWLVVRRPVCTIRVEMV
jgi:hypothetical protein